MTNSIFQNPFDIWLIEELRTRYGIVQKEIQAIIWFPVAPYDQFTCAIRFCKGITKKDFSSDDLVEKILCVGNYLNISLNKEKFVDKVINVINERGDTFGFNLKYHGVKIAIEHTSLTPSYPINLSTFRSSIIGNALVHYYEKFGAEVNVHYLVADRARNIELVLNSTSYLDSLNYVGKPDHVCGALFCSALVRIGKFGAIEYIPKMFPKQSKSKSPVTTQKFNNVQTYCDYCLSGHMETLLDASIKIDTFDYESAVIKGSNKERASYLDCNIAYYSLLAADYDNAYSVVSSRQKEVVSKALQTLKKNIATKVIPIYFNDIVCKVADSLGCENELLPDSIKSAIFHSVDSYIETICLKYGLPKKRAYNALKLMVLSYNVTSIIVIDYNNYEDIEFFVRLLDRIDHIEQNATNNSTIKSNDMLLAKNLILSNQIFSLNCRDRIIKTKELTTANIVKYIILLVELVYGGVQNRRLLKCVRQTIKNAMNLLGLEE